MKTLKEWSEYLPEPIRGQFLRSIDPNYHLYKKEQPNLLEAIRCSFEWSDTEEGWNYWHKVQLTAKQGKYNNLPIKTEIVINNTLFTIYDVNFNKDNSSTEEVLEKLLSYYYRENLFVSKLNEA